MRDEATSDDRRGGVRNAGQAWKQTVEDVAKRNAEVSKVARQEREAYERQKTAGRDALERREMARLLEQQHKR